MKDTIKNEDNNVMRLALELLRLSLGAETEIDFAGSTYTVRKVAEVT